MCIRDSWNGRGIRPPDRCRSNPSSPCSTCSASTDTPTWRWTGSLGRSPRPRSGTSRPPTGCWSTGVVGNQTWPALIVQVANGSRGDAVRAVQSQFQARNLSGDPSKGLQIDGIFGPQTEGAVRSFQQAVGIGVDGIVGPVTWNSLVNGALAL